jgi:hypothetical protein
MLAVMPAFAEITSKTYVNNRFNPENSETNVAVVTTDTNGNPVVANTKVLADVATSGSYNDLTDTPTIPNYPTFPTGLSVSEILTGTATDEKLINAQTANVAMGKFVTTAGSTSAYTANVPGFVLQTGAMVRLKLHVANVGAPTLNVNGTGAKPIYSIGTTAPSDNNYFMQNSVIEVVYDSVNDGYRLVGEPTHAVANPNHVRAGSTGAFVWSGANLKAGVMSYAGDIKTTAGTSSSYTITDTTNYTTTGTYLNSGTKVVIKAHVVNNAGATLNINSLGAKAIFLGGAAITAGALNANGVYTLVYDGTQWNVVESPGGTGGGSGYTLPSATTTTLGGVKLGSDTVQTIAAAAISAATGRTYAVQNDSNGRMVVNVPWDDTNNITSATTTGTGNAVTSVSADANGALTINKGATFLTSFTETDPSINTTIMSTAANAVSTSGTAGKVYAVQKDSSGKAVVAVPWDSGTGGGTDYTGTAPIIVSSGNISHTDSGVSAATYGPGADATLASGGAFVVPSVTVDAKGHVTSAVGRTLQLPILPDIPTPPSGCSAAGTTCSLNFGMCTAEQNMAGTACATASYYWENIKR